MTDKETRLGRLIKDLDPSRNFIDNFDDFLDFGLSLFIANQTEEMQKAFFEHVKDHTFQEAMAVFGEASANYHDCFGDVFMERISHGEHDQFFTPQHIAELMAEVVQPEGEGICDMACGSGRLLLGGLKKAREKGYEPWIYAADLDRRCCRMALLNLCINGARGEVRNANAMTGECFGAWKIDRLLVGGIWVSWVWYYDKDTDMDALNADRQKQIEEMAYKGVIFDYEQPGTHQTPTEPKQEPIATPTPEPAKTEPKQVEPLQLSLF